MRILIDRGSWPVALHDIAGDSVSVTLLFEREKVQLTFTEKDGNVTMEILGAAGRNQKWREAYSGPIPANANVIYQIFAQMTARRLTSVDISDTSE